MTFPLAHVAVDVQAAVQLHFYNHFGARARSVTELPPDLEAAMPVIQTVMVGGPVRNSLSHASVSVQVYAANSQTSMDLALEAINTLKFDAPKATFAGLVITGLTVNALPQYWNYDNPNVRRTVTLIDLYCHPA